MKPKSLRKVIAFILCLTLVMAVFPVSASTEQKPEVYSVATAHLDTAWNWPLDTTISDYLPDTLESNFDLLDEYPDYIFNFEGAYRYQLIKEYYPDLYEELKEYVADGSWRPTGAVWENGDVNIPSPEALMRNILYGNEFFEDEFGVVDTDYFLPDCFGFGYALPTIAAHMGLKSFSTAKLIWSDVNYLPFDFGKWIGVDGSSILATLDPDKYNSSLSSDITTDDDYVEKAEGAYDDDELSADDIMRIMKYYGTGDTGGAPAESSISNMEEAVNDEDGDLTLVSAYSGQMEEEMNEDEIDALDSYDGELLMKFHGNGTLTADTISKLLNRKDEQLADAAERSSVLADWLGTQTYDMDTLKEAWLRVLSGQHHDNITGTSIAAVYSDMINDYIAAMNQFEGTMESADSSVINSMDTKVEDGVPVVVTNDVSKDRDEVVEMTVTMDQETDYVRVYDSQGDEVPSQVESVDGNDVDILFLASVESDGTALYNVVPSSTPCDLDTGLSVTSNTLENDRYEVTVDDQGDISSIYDKTYDREILDEPITLEQFGNTYTNYGIWEISYDDYEKGPSSVVGEDNDQNVDISIEEDGPARVSLKISRTHNASTYVQEVSLSAGDSSNWVNVDNNVMWGETSSFLKAAFPLTVFNDNATYDLGLGTIERDNSDSDNQYEVPAQQWADITDEDGDYGVTIMNDSKYGWDKPADNELRLTLFHTPQEEREDNSKQDTVDYGENNFTYAIMGHDGDWRDGESQYSAECLNQPLKAYQTTSHDGDIDADMSFISLDTNQVMVKAVKRAEDSDEYIVRVYELYGQDADDVHLSMGDGIESMRAVNGYETEITDDTASIEDGDLVFDLTAYEPKTFAVTLADPEESLTSIESESIDISDLMNIDIISSDDDPTDGGYGPSAYTFPSELLPEDQVVTNGGVDFELGDYDDGAMNAVQSEGQTITLPEGTTRVYLLAGSATSDKDYTFTLGDTTETESVQSMWEYVGSWDQYGFGRYGNIKEDTIAYLSDHTHDPTGDMINDHSYLFKYALDVPEGTTSLTLPDDDDLIIAAVSAQTNTTEESSIGTQVYPVNHSGQAHRLVTTDGDASGAYHYGNPITLNYTGDEEGIVVWEGDDGSSYFGESVQLNMPDYDLTLTPTIISFGDNLALDAEVEVSGYTNDNEIGDYAVDGDDTTKWCTSDTSEQWLTIDLGQATPVDAIVLRNAGDGGESEEWDTGEFQIQVEDPDGDWQDIESVMSNHLNVNTETFSSYYTRYIRLNVTRATTKTENNTAARIYELEVYNHDAPDSTYASDPLVEMDTDNTANVFASVYNPDDDANVRMVTTLTDKDGETLFTNEATLLSPSDVTSLESQTTDSALSVSYEGDGYTLETSTIEEGTSHWVNVNVSLPIDITENISDNDRLSIYFVDGDGQVISSTYAERNIVNEAVIDGQSTIEAEDYTDWSGGDLKVEDTTLADESTVTDVGGTSEDAWLTYDNVDFGTDDMDQVTISYVNNSNRCASDAYVEVREGSADGDLLGTIDLPSTGSTWTDYATVTGSLDVTISDSMDLCFVLKGTTDSDHPYIANLDSFTFSIAEVIRDDYDFLELEDYDDWDEDDNPYNDSPMKTEDGVSGDQVANTYDGAWLLYRNMDFGDTGVNKVSIYYCGNTNNTYANAAVEIRLGSADGELVGTVETPPTASSWGTYELATADLTETVTGVQDLYLVLTGSDSDYKYVGNFDYAIFENNDGSGQEENEELTTEDIQTIQAEDYTSWSEGNLKTESSTDSNGDALTDIGGTYDDAWMTYDVDIDDGDTVDAMTIRYVNNSSRCAEDAAIEIHKDDAEGDLLGTIDIPSTGSSWTAYDEVTGQLDTPITEDETIALVLTGTTTDDEPYICNLDYMTLQTITRDDYDPLELEDYDYISEDVNPVNENPLKTESGDSGDQIANTFDGAWVGYDAMDFGEEGVDTVSVHYSGNSTNTTSDAAIEIYVDGLEGQGTLVATVDTPPTDTSWGTYDTVTADLNQTLTGVHDIYIVMTGSTTQTYKYIGNFDYVDFTKKE